MYFTFLNLLIFLFQLEPYMDEDFLKHALSQMGEENVISIKVKRDHATSTLLRF